MSWIIEAIEQAAEKRAIQKLAEGNLDIEIYGLTGRQIMCMKIVYEGVTGRRAQDIEQNISEDAALMKKLKMERNEK